MIVHAYASLQHYADHLAPVLAALPERHRGEMWSPSERKPWGRTLAGRGDRDAVWMIAGFADAERLRGRCLVHVEHGAGQTYPGDPRSAGHGAFSGGDGLGHVGLFLCPSETVAARWARTYPACSTAVVGCPKLDRWHRDPRVMSPAQTVAITWHHSNAQIAEQTPAWQHFRDVIPEVRDQLRRDGVQLLGHGHPRAWRTYRPFWERLGIEATDSLAEVFDRADVLVADNTSAAYEFASLGRPIVWMSAPWYRRDVEHGGRFWDDVRGLPHAEEPAELLPMIRRALDDPMPDQIRRSEIVQRTYSVLNGEAATTAAWAVMAWATDAWSARA